MLTVKKLHDPVISIAMKDFVKPYFIAAGQFSKPGKYDLREDTRAAEAVAIAGGFNNNAKNSQVILFRRVSKGWIEAKQLNQENVQSCKVIGGFASPAGRYAFCYQRTLCLKLAGSFHTRVWEWLLLRFPSPRIQ